MKYVFPNNLMARRNERKEMIRGGILLAVFCLLIIGLFFASEYGQSGNYINLNIACTEQSGCHLE